MAAGGIILQHLRQAARGGAPVTAALFRSQHIADPVQKRAGGKLSVDWQVRLDSIQRRQGRHFSPCAGSSRRQFSPHIHRHVVNVQPHPGLPIGQVTDRSQHGRAWKTSKATVSTNSSLFVGQWGLETPRKHMAAAGIKN
jgi:hypothetical protein